MARRMGGSADPTVHHQSNLITLCRSCHRKIHEGRWEMERSPEMVRVMDRATASGVIHRNSAARQKSRLSARINRIA